MDSESYSKARTKNYYFMLAVGVPIIAFMILGSQFMWNDSSDGTQTSDENIPPKFENTKEDRYTVQLRTDSSKYIPGQVQIIQGTVIDSEGNPVNVNVDFIIENESDSQVLSASTFSNDGKFRITDVSIESTGIYTIYAKAWSAKDSSQDGSPNGDDVGYGQTIIHVVEFYKTKLGTGIIATIVFTISLLIMIYIQTKIKLRITSVETLRFAFFTLCSLIPIVSLLAADAQIGQDSPFGLVLRETTATLEITDLRNAELANQTIGQFIEENIVQKFEWIIHVGGSPHDNYQSGISIPVYVFIFGMLGGYLRFLHKTASGWFVAKARKEWMRLNPHKKSEELEKQLIDLATRADNDGYLIRPQAKVPSGKDDGELDRKTEQDKALIRRIIFNNSMEDLALIFLSPILALVTFFILTQGGIDATLNMPTMAIASFATGLITNEIISRLESIAKSSISNSKNEIDSKKSD